jgi:hypothetical protein
MRGERRQESRDDRKTNRDVDGETTRIDKDGRACKGRGWNNVDGRPPMGGVVGLERRDKRDKREENGRTFSFVLTQRGKSARWPEESARGRRVAPYRET